MNLLNLFKKIIKNLKNSLNIDGSLEKYKRANKEANKIVGFVVKKDSFNQFSELIRRIIEKIKFSSVLFVANAELNENAENKVKEIYKNDNGENSDIDMKVYENFSEKSPKKNYRHFRVQKSNVHFYTYFPKILETNNCILDTKSNIEKKSIFVLENIFSESEYFKENILKKDPTHTIIIFFQLDINDFKNVFYLLGNLLPKSDSTPLKRI